MGFYHSKSKLPLRGRKKLPMRGKRGRRLTLLRQFEVGHVYTFCENSDLDDVPDDVLLWDDDEYPNGLRV